MPLSLSPDERRRRRLLLRELGRSLMDESVASPCVSICRIDGTTNLCLGCSRSVGEVTDWSLLTADEKRIVLNELPSRAPARDAAAT